jgi:dTDP-4-dehydrorhamnose reductase
MGIMKVFITGGSGLLGSSLVYSFVENGNSKVFATYNNHPIEMEEACFIPLDITNKKDIFQRIENVDPDVVVHTAALTNVDFCEDNSEVAREVNIGGTKNVAKACAKIDAKMIYISTDYIFDGRKGNYSEIDIPAPINYYGKTKLEGENMVKNFATNYTIVRTSLYGWNIQKKLSFAEWIITNLEKNQRINVLADQFSSLMLVNDCAEIILKIIEANITGLYNVASCEKVSKFYFAKRLAEIFDLDESLIIPITTEELSKKMNQKARRPKDVSLNVGKIGKKLNVNLPKIDEGLIRMEKLEERGYVDSFDLRGGE